MSRTFLSRPRTNAKGTAVRKRLPRPSAAAALGLANRSNTTRYISYPTSAYYDQGQPEAMKGQAFVSIVTSETHIGQNKKLVDQT